MVLRRYVKTPSKIKAFLNAEDGRIMKVQTDVKRVLFRCGFGKFHGDKRINVGNVGFQTLKSTGLCHLSFSLLRNIWHQPIFKSVRNHGFAKFRFLKIYYKH